eukprot:1184538-Amphidinium_carterae.2
MQHKRDRERDPELPDAKRARAKPDADVDLTQLDGEDDSRASILSEEGEDRQKMPHEEPLWPAKSTVATARDYPLPQGLRPYAPIEQNSGEQPPSHVRLRGRSAERGNGGEAATMAGPTRDHSFAPSSVT